MTDKRINRWATIAPMAIILISATACGTRETGSSEVRGDESFEVRESSEFAEILDRVEVATRDSKFDDEFTAAQTVETFDKEYGVKNYPGEPEVFAATLVSSNQQVLSAGTEVRVVHFSEVTSPGSAPMLPEGVAADGGGTSTDMFSFFGTDGTLLVTMYVGP